jgi:hypothetical protein
MLAGDAYHFTHSLLRAPAVMQDRMCKNYRIAVIRKLNVFCVKI